MRERSRPLARLATGTLLLVLATACTDETLTEPASEVGAPTLAAVMDLSVAPVSQHVVTFKKGVPSGFAAEVASRGGNLVFSHSIGFALVSGLDDDGAAGLANVKNVDSVVADESFTLDDPGTPLTESASIASPDDPTSATRFARQWNLRQIGADQAWAAGRLGNPGVTIAILDSGIGYTHPDLVGRVDLSRSASFVPADDNLLALAISLGIFPPGTHPVADMHFHGTHVASTASSNSLATAGVTSKTTLMGVKVCDVNGSCPFGSTMAGILHAADNGADVANMSLGGGFGKAGNGQFVSLIHNVFNYARQQGVTMVVSAGNNAIDLDHQGNLFKTYCDAVHVVCVSATGPTASGGVDGPWANPDALASYSNFGQGSISVAAPGGTSAGAVWASCSPFSLQIPICRTGVFILGISGTSMASPHVSGTAALIVEDVGTNPATVKAKLRKTADDLGKRGTDDAYGHGRINTAAAVGQ